MDSQMQKIADAINKCTKCEISNYVKNKVVGRGSRKPRIIFLGEAPGKSEDLTGKPFVGPSGKLLESWITYLSLKPTDYAILNVCKCRPTNGDDKDRAPTDEERANCLPFLRRQIEILKPEIIVALGNTALRTCILDFSQSVSSVAGEFLDRPSIFNSRIYAMFHPAYFLRNHRDGKQFLEKLKSYLYNESKSEEIPYQKVLSMNQQAAENLSVHEMISPVLSAIHSFAKKAGRIFKDVNQKDECYIGEKFCKIVVRSAAEDVDFLIREDEIEKQKYDCWVIGYSQKGNYDFVGYVNRDILSVTPSRDHFNKGFLVKAVQPSSFNPIYDLLPVLEEEDSEKEQIEKQRFIPLHLHTEYSIGDAYGKLPDIGKIIKKKGYEACAITDHGTLSGTIYFQKACLENGVKPIIGTEAYVLLEDDIKGQSYHLVLLVKNKTGWKNLLYLHDKASREHFYYKPKMLLDEILEHPEGLIAMTACTSGILSRHIIEGQTDKAREIAEKLKAAFGEDLYFEIIFNEGVPHQKEVNAALLKLGEELGIKCVVTSDSHYPNKEDHLIHQAIKAISYNKPFDESGFSDTTFYYLQDKDVYELSEPHKYITKERVTELIETTREVADKCNFVIERDWDDALPVFSVPEEMKEKFSAWCKAKGYREDDNSLLRYIAYKGFYEKGFAGKKEYQDRLELELDRFIAKGYAKYFLIVWDYVNFCKKSGIMVGPGRGSAGSSLVAYCMEITKVDPLKYDLLFDRFVSPIRKDMPDIDLDFEDARRGEVIEYLKQKYGEERGAKIITFSRWHGKGALRDVGRIFGISIGEINRITNLVITRSGGDARAGFTLEDTFTEFEQAKEFQKKYPEQVRIAKALEGSIRHCGLHAAAFVVAKNPIYNYLPTHRMKGEIVAAFEKKEVENFGLIKFDILGLKTLTVISNTLKLLGKEKKDVQLPESFDDKEVYEKVFKPGNTLGVFQAETTGMSKLLKSLQVDNFKLLYDANSLYRPGPLHCLAGDSLVKTVEGEKKIKDIQNGDRIFSSGYSAGGNGKKVHKFIENEVLEKFDRGIQPTYLVVDSFGNKIECTKKHRFFTKQGWKRLEQLNAGDYVLVVSSDTIAWKEITEIRYVGRKHVYDLAMKNKEFPNYIANNFIVHNSGETATFVLRHLGKQKWDYDHPLLEPIKKDTYGLILYQEQVMKVMFEIGKFSWATAEASRKIITKSKGKDMFEKMRNEFIANAEREHHMSKEESGKIFDVVSTFGCLDKDTKIVSFSEKERKPVEITIEQAYESKMQNLKLLSMSAKGLLTYNAVKKIHPTGQKMVYLIETDSGKFIEATAEHRFLVNDKWVQVKNIKVGDWIKVVPDQKETGIVADDRIFRKIPVGWRQTFDIEMEDPPRNFIANGFVSHNSYGFNKSHSIEYSMIGYYCAWLKTHYPREFFSAILSFEGDPNMFADYIRDAKRLGVKVYLPEVNGSKMGFSPYKDGIIGGFSSINGIGARTAERFIANQPYADLLDFIRRGKPNLTAFRALVTIGALDSWIKNRKVFFEQADEILKAARKKKDEIKNLEELLDLVDQTQPDWTEKERAEMMLRYYSVPGEKHAIEYFDDPFLPFLKDRYERIGELEFDDYIDERWIKGIVTFINFKQEGLEGQWTMFDNVLERRYAHLNVSDGTGNVLVHLSPEQYTYYKHFFETGTGFAVIIKGHSIKDFNKIYCDAMIVLNDIDNNNPVIKYIKYNRRQKELEKIKQLFPGFQAGVIQNVTYKVSKNKKPYARIKFTDGKEYLCFKLDSNIFVAGEIVVYSVDTHPFMRVIRRL